MKISQMRFLNKVKCIDLLKDFLILEKLAELNLEVTYISKKIGSKSIECMLLGDLYC